MRRNGSIVPCCRSAHSRHYFGREERAPIRTCLGVKAGTDDHETLDAEFDEFEQSFYAMIDRPHHSEAANKLPRKGCAAQLLGGALDDLEPSERRDEAGGRLANRFDIWMTNDDDLYAVTDTVISEFLLAACRTRRVEGPRHALRNGSDTERHSFRERRSHFDHLWTGRRIILSVVINVISICLCQVAGSDSTNNPAPTLPHC